MSNILSDQHRQSIGRAIVASCGIKSFVECGCHEGASMLWWAEQGIPHIYGCDINPKSLLECERHVKAPAPVLELADSRAWLKTLSVEMPALVHLDTDWNDDHAKATEFEILFDLWRDKDFVIVANSVNQPNHPCYVAQGKTWKPTTVESAFAAWGSFCRQFVVPLYSYPLLGNGYAVMNHTQIDVTFDPVFFEDLCHV